MDEKSKALVAEIFLDIESLRPPDDQGDKKMIGLWLLASYKTRFDSLQEKTQKAFGKKIQELIMEAIDQVDGKL